MALASPLLPRLSWASSNYELLNIANGELFSPSEAGRILKQVGLSSDDYLSREITAKLFVRE